jgi:uncharacterized protein with PQ loop repeat
MLSAFYFLSFARFTPKGASTLPGTLDQHMQCFVAVVAFVLWFAQKKQPGPIGKVGVVINMAMYASPLAAIRAVLQTKSSESIPLPLTVASLASCILWTITGYLEMQDPYVWVPTIFGIAFGLAQVALKIAFSGRKEDGATKVPSPDLNSNEVVLNTTKIML